MMEISRNSPRTTREVFDQYTVEHEDYGFQKTTVALKLASEGTELVSRSQARRVVSRLDPFRVVILNFAEVTSISPAFADEVFRVFGSAHPETKIHAINANESIRQMITKALGDAATQAK